MPTPILSVARSTIDESGFPGGVLPDVLLRKAVERSFIFSSDSSSPITDGQFQPASIDLRLGKKAYRVKTSFLPGEQPVTKRLSEFQMGPEIPLTHGAVLEPNRPYLIPIVEQLRLPPDISAKTNPKSSTGRVDIFARVVTDFAKRFDEIPQGYQGNLWLELYSRSFTIRVKAGMPLNQIRLISHHDVDTHQIDYPPKSLTVDLRCSPELDEGDNSHIVGFCARDGAGLLDLTKTDFHAPEEFWEPIWSNGGKLLLHPEKFYLLRSAESLSIPLDQAAEMIAFDPTSGELRTHYAGFFDPGFGYPPNSGGLPAVLEIRSHDVLFMIEHGQHVATLGYKAMSRPSENAYGSSISSHYDKSRQLGFLSKYFKQSFSVQHGLRLT